MRARPWGQHRQAEEHRRFPALSMEVSFFRKAVVSRTWAGINKPGGVGRVLRVQTVDGDIQYDVKYVLGGSEKCIEAEFVSKVGGANVSSAGASARGRGRNRRGGESDAGALGDADASGNLPRLGSIASGRASNGDVDHGSSACLSGEPITPIMHL